MKRPSPKRKQSESLVINVREWHTYILLYSGYGCACGCGCARVNVCIMCTRSGIFHFSQQREQDHYPYLVPDYNSVIDLEFEQDHYSYLVPDYNSVIDLAFEQDHYSYLVPDYNSVIHLAFLDLLELR